MTETRVDNLVYVHLDKKVALGGADDPIVIDGVELTRAGLLDRVAKVAGILQALGVGPGDRVSIDVGNDGPTPAILTLALWRIGALVADDAPVRIDREAPAASESEVHGAFLRGRSRSLASHLEGTFIHEGEDAWDLGALTRETGIQSAVAARLPASQRLRAGSDLTAGDLLADPAHREAPAWWAAIARAQD